MKVQDVEKLIENEKEWRRYVVDRLTVLEKEVSSLTGKVTIISSLVGSLFGVAISWAKTKLGA